MKTNLNFLPQSVRRRQVIRDCLIRWSVLAVVCLLALAVFGWHESRLATARQIEVSKLQRKHEAFVALQSSVDILEQELLTPVNLTSDFNSANQYPKLTLMGEISKATAACNGRLFVQTFRFQQLKEKSAGTDIYDVTMGGFAVDAASVESFTQRLRAAGIFRQVKILSTAEAKRDEIPVIVYQLRCSF